MENYKSAEIETETTEPAKKGLTRRQVAVGAAWAVPVVALAVGAPAQAASLPVDSIGLQAAFSALPNFITFGPGSIYNQNPSSPTVSTGPVKLELQVPSSYSFTAAQQALIVNAGWVAASTNHGATGTFDFTHVAVQGDTIITFPLVKITGTAKGQSILAVISSALGSTFTGFAR